MNPLLSALILWLLLAAVLAWAFAKVARHERERGRRSAQRDIDMARRARQ